MFTGDGSPIHHCQTPNPTLFDFIHANRGLGPEVHPGSLIIQTALLMPQIPGASKQNGDMQALGESCHNHASGASGASSQAGFGGAHLPNIRLLGGRKSNVSLRQKADMKSHDAAMLSTIMLT